MLFSPLPTIVFISAQWCSHCIAFKPTYKYLAKKLKDTDIKFCQMDGELNEVPGVNIEKYPLILLYKESGEKLTPPEEFSAQPNLESIINWINTYIPHLGIELTK